MRTAITCALMAFTITGAEAEVDNHSANYLLPACKALVSSSTKESLMLQGFCGGMVSGIAVMAQVPKAVCIPDAASALQMVRVVVQYLEARPNRLHERFEGLALEALAKAWPCRN
jgi:hypothetical protein